jgi:hypothetical protein
MRRIIFILQFLLFTAVSFAGNPVLVSTNTVTENGRTFDVHLVEWPADGHIEFSGMNALGVGVLKPGDRVEFRRGASILDTTLITLGIFDVTGTVNNDIDFTTDQATHPLYINNSGWNGGGYATPVTFERCRYINFYARNKGDLVILGPVGSERSQSFNILMYDRTSDFDLYNIITYDGGTALQLKTEVTHDSATWVGRTPVGNIKIYNNEFYRAKNEANYIGSTAIYRNVAVYAIKAPGRSVLEAGYSVDADKEYGYVYQPNFWNDALLDTVADGPTDTVTFKKPLVYNNVMHYNNIVDSCGNDAFQFANIKGLQVFGNYCTDWGYNDANGHRYAIILGSHVTHSYVYNNAAIGSTYGEGLAHFATGGSHTVDNNLFYNFAGDMVFIKGGEHNVNPPDNPYVVRFTNNTFFSITWGIGVRISPQMGGILPHKFHNNIFGDVAGLDWAWQPYYFYEETSAGYTADYVEGTDGSANGKYLTLEDADLDPLFYLQELSGSPVDDEGYKIPLPRTKYKTYKWHYGKRVRQL